MVAIISRVKPQGFLKIVARDVRTGRVVFREEKPNLVTIGTKGIIARLLTQLPGNAVENDRIWAIHIGNSNAPAVTNQTGLQGTVITKKAINQPMTIDSPAETSGIVEAEVTFDTTDHVGESICEVGLYSRGSDGSNLNNSYAKMLARQVHGEVIKTSNITITYTWRFQITV